MVGDGSLSSHRARARGSTVATHLSAKRRKEPKEEKVRYKSLRTASRPLKEVLGYLEGSDSYSSENSNVPGIFIFVEQTNIHQMALG